MFNGNFLVTNNETLCQRSAILFSIHSKLLCSFPKIQTRLSRYNIIRLKNIYNPAAHQQDSILNVLDFHVYNLFSALLLSVSIMIPKGVFFPRTDISCLWLRLIIFYEFLSRWVSDLSVSFVRWILTYFSCDSFIFHTVWKWFGIITNAKILKSFFSTWYLKLSIKTSLYLSGFRMCFHSRTVAVKK